MSSSSQKWFPLESNPTLMNKYITNLGFDTNLFEFVDVFSTEDWALEMIAQPVAAVLMLYPLSPAQIDGAKKDDIVYMNFKDNDNNDDDVWFMKQRIGNACGTIGLLHGIYNMITPDPSIKLACYKPNSWISNFYQQTCSTGTTTTSIQKAELLECDTQISKLHDQATSSEENATNRGNIDDKIDTHFIAFVCSNKNNKLLELDGRKDGPIDHGTTTPQTLLQDSCNIIKNTFMARDPQELRFTILALAPKQM